MKTAFMFSGQGSQQVGMGKELYENYDICKKVFDAADSALGFKITKLCFEENPKLNETEYTQPALLTLSMAIYALIKSKNIKPDYVLGLSLGEYSALVASGAFSFKDATTLVHKRGQFMAEACKDVDCAMSAIMKLDRNLIFEACNEASTLGIVSPTNFNTQDQVVIGGEKIAVEKAEELAKESGAKRCVRLNVSGAFHTKLLESASVKLNKELSELEINEMEIPVVTNLTGAFIHSKSEIIPTLVNQVKSPVMWEDSIKFLISQGVDTFVELGIGKTLCSFVKKIDSDVTTLNIEDVKSFNDTLMNLEE